MISNDTRAQLSRCCFEAIVSGVISCQHNLQIVKVKTARLSSQSLVSMTAYENKVGPRTFSVWLSIAC